MVAGDFRGWYPAGHVGGHQLECDGLFEDLAEGGAGVGRGPGREPVPLELGEPPGDLLGA